MTRCFICLERIEDEEDIGEVEIEANGNRMRVPRHKDCYAEGGLE